VPGPDQIPYIALRKGPNILIKILAELCNASLNSGYISHKWKTAYTMYIPKPNKHRLLSENYRPITLTNTISKICETILAKRLNTFLEDSNIICNSQAGFRAKASTIDQACRIVQMALNKGLKAAVIFMDLSSAFDTVWQDGLIYKLYAMNLPTTTIRCLIKFLKERTTKVKIGEDLSDNITIRR